MLTPDGPSLSLLTSPLNMPNKNVIEEERYSVLNPPSKKVNWPIADCKRRTVYQGI